MIVKPYKKGHKPKRIVLVTAEAEYVDEYGDALKPNSITSDDTCFLSWDTARRLTIQRRGESLLWAGEHIRWRPVQHPTEDVWKRRPYDAAVIRLPFSESLEDNLSALAEWRDWLAHYRAVPGTMGSASLSLLKATVRKTLFCSTHWDVQRLRQTAGGIITRGQEGNGTYRGTLTHWDLPAAYASEIGHMRYGGHWFDLRDAPGKPGLDRNRLDEFLRLRVPLYLRAQVYVPKALWHGPLPSRPRKPLHPFKAQILTAAGERYPTGKTIQGIWTYEELLVAEQVGCTVKLLEGWGHWSPKDSPFRFWWAAIVEGRTMPGLAGMLAKTTGNALWGQFALNPETFGQLSIHYKPRGARRMRVRRPPAHWHKRLRIHAIDLAEIVAGRTRARLYAAMVKADGNLICAHTDGIWTRNTPDNFLVNEGWRAKARAQRLDLLSPQVMRYYSGDRTHVMYAGVPNELAVSCFERDWGRFEQIQASAA